jgi:hypothetical protein
MAGAGGAGPAVSINLSDLRSGQLKTLIENDGKPVLNFATDFANNWDKPIQSVSGGISGAVTVTGKGSWKTGGVGIGFSLSGTAKGTVRVVASGAVVKYAPDLTSQTASAGLPAEGYPNLAYIVVSLDFEIDGSASGSGTAGGVAISGKIKGSSDTSVVFCHRVSNSMTVGDAVREALENFIFALDPECANAMAAGDISQVNFTGSLAFGLTASYGFPNIAFSAASVASVLDSVTKGAAQFTLPTGKIAIGAQATVNYTHSDAFTAIVEKTDAANAFLYVMRANKNDLTGGLGISAKVAITNKSGVTVDSAQLTDAVNRVTGGVGGDQAASGASDIEQGLNSKLGTWITDEAKNGASLGLQWDAQNNTLMLFKYQIALASLAKTWDALCNGNVLGAVASGGLVPLPGSGVSSQLDHPFTMSLHFFNLFAATDKMTYFKNTYVTIAHNGDILYNYDIGKETDVDVKKSKKTCRIHFVISVDKTTAATVTKADVDLNLEISATGNQRELGRIAAIPGFIPNIQGDTLKTTLREFASANPTGTLDLICVLKPSAYARLSCSPYSGSKPPADQHQDSLNWEVFRNASAAPELLNLDSVSKLIYADWGQYNVACTGNSEGIADRRNPGNLATVPVTAQTYFLVNSARFMNLCDDLHALGTVVAASSSPHDLQTYNNLLLSLAQLIVKGDVDHDYSKTAIAALLGLIKPESLTSSSVKGKGSLTCTVTLT